MYITQESIEEIKNNPSPAQRPLEDITYMLFGYLKLNEQPSLNRPAGGTEHIVVIAESMKPNRV